MSVQVSTRIDEKTKQQFDDICEAIGASPSNVLSMLIKGVVNHNGIPFNVVAFPGERAIVRPPFEYGRGCMKGKMWMADDFDAPLDDFKEYME